MIMKRVPIFILVMTISNLQAQQVERKFKVTKKYLNLPVQETQDRRAMAISAKGKDTRKFVIRLSEDRPDYWVFADLSDYKGQSITVTYPSKVKGFGQIYQSNEIAGSDSLYKEKSRPQFHFTSRRGWNNDPNGLVYYKGNYHLYYQHNPYESNWENMHWGHAVSKNLIHWKELGDVLYPDELGTMFSGSAVVDFNNSAGFQTGDEQTLIAAYTAHKSVDDGARQTQCIAYSNDSGLTWTKYEGNPVIDSKDIWNSSNTRDPKIFWHDESNKWVMVLFEKDGHSFYNSDDLKNWTYLSHLRGFWECPELFELPVDGDQNNKKWVIYGASGTYFIGDFDGKEFTVESGKHTYCSGGLYAAQTYNNIPQSDGRRIQMAWGQIDHPGKPSFTQMMVFPTEFSLKTTRNGIRLFNQPIKEIELLHNKSFQLGEVSIADANTKLQKTKGDLFHIKMKVEILEGTSFQLHFRGNPILDYSMNHNLLNGSFYAGDDSGLIKAFEVLIDRTSAEIYADEGGFTVVLALEAPKNDNGLEIYKHARYKEDPIKIHSLEVHELKSIWND